MKLHRLVVFSLSAAIEAYCSEQQQLLLPSSSSLTRVSIDQTWDVLGPFRIGTREVQWGADPLEHYHGFHSLRYDRDATFASSLAPNATVKWTRTIQAVDYHDDGRCVAHLSVNFPSIDWTGLRLTYGWAALQYQCWLRCGIHVPHDAVKTYLLEVDHVLELRVDGRHYFGGDFYGFHRAPIVITLSPGLHHSIEIRLYRDVRADGGTDEPTIEASVKLIPVTEQQQLLVGTSLVPDVVASKFTSAYGSLLLTNTAQRNICITRIVSKEAKIRTSMISTHPICLRASQTRPAAFHVAFTSVNVRTFVVHVYYTFVGVDRGAIDVELDVNFRHVWEPQKITYLHPSGIVSYAILRPPPRNNLTASACQSSLPIVVALHGAGLEAESDIARHALDAVADLPAWTLFPSGVTPWSGDDWHTWGWADIESAVAAVPTWIQINEWNGPNVDISRWLVVGHSNGGQGVWYALAHRPDNIIAAAPLSGYISIPHYVPSTFWQQTEDFKLAIVSAAISDDRHDLLVPANAQDIPIAIQHGSEDDNVPTYHSRQMYQNLCEYDHCPAYSELANEGHWFEGIATTSFLKQFYNAHIASSPPQNFNARPFEVVSANPRGTGPKFGLRILELSVPGRLGKIKATRKNGTQVFITSNVRSFSLQSEIYVFPITIDMQQIANSTLEDKDPMYFQLKSDGQWRLRSSSLEACHVPVNDNEPSSGGLDSILRTTGRFGIVSTVPVLDRFALQIARNFVQYFHADAEIASSKHGLTPDVGNIITLCVGENTRAGSAPGSSVRIDAGVLSIEDSSGKQWQYVADEDGLGAIFLRPHEKSRLELVIWGIDVSSLAVAARLVPLLTGTGQPDFIVMSRQMLQKSVGGAIALGFFDTDWRASIATSFFS